MFLSRINEFQVKTLKRTSLGTQTNELDPDEKMRDRPSASQDMSGLSDVGRFHIN